MFNSCVPSLTALPFEQAGLDIFSAIGRSGSAHKYRRGLCLRNLFEEEGFISWEQNTSL